MFWGHALFEESTASGRLFNPTTMVRVKSVSSFRTEYRIITVMFTLHYNIIIWDIFIVVGGGGVLCQQDVRVIRRCRFSVVVSLFGSDEIFIFPRKQWKPNVQYCTVAKQITQVVDINAYIMHCSNVYTPLMQCTRRMRRKRHLFIVPL